MPGLTTLFVVAAAGVTAAVVPLPFVWRFVAGVLVLVLALAIISLIKAILGLVVLVVLIAGVAFLASRFDRANRRPAGRRRGGRQL
jgi:hypothetical protein